MFVDGYEWGTATGHVIGPTGHYDVIDFVFVSKRRERKINDVIMTCRFYHETSRNPLLEGRTEMMNDGSFSSIHSLYKRF